MTQSRPRHRPHAFTLVELLVVIAIVALLATLATVVSGRMVERGHSVACLQNLRSIGQGLSAHLADNANTFPTLAPGRTSRDEPLPVLDTELTQYLPDEEVFHCPADRKLYEATGNSYHWNSIVSGQNVAALNFLGVEDVSHVPLVGDKEAFHPHQKPRVNLLYADGRATSEITFFTD